MHDAVQQLVVLASVDGGAVHRERLTVEQRLRESVVLGRGGDRGVGSENDRADTVGAVVGEMPNEVGAGALRDAQHRLGDAGDAPEVLHEAHWIRREQPLRMVDRDHVVAEPEIPSARSVHPPLGLVEESVDPVESHRHQGVAGPDRRFGQLPQLRLPAPIGAGRNQAAHLGQPRRSRWCRRVDAETLDDRNGLARPRVEVCGHNAGVEAPQPAAPQHDELHACPTGELDGKLSLGAGDAVVRCRADRVGDVQEDGHEFLRPRRTLASRSGCGAVRLAPAPF